MVVQEENSDINDENIEEQEEDVSGDEKVYSLESILYLQHNHCSPNITVLLNEHVPYVTIHSNLQTPFLFTVSSPIPRRFQTNRFTIHKTR